MIYWTVVLNRVGDAMSKFIAILLITLFCLSVALIPEAVMWGTYRLIHPTTELARIIVLVGFWLVGSGVCIGFAALGVVLWTALANEVLK